MNSRVIRAARVGVQSDREPQRGSPMNGRVIRAARVGVQSG